MAKQQATTVATQPISSTPHLTDSQGKELGVWGTLFYAIKSLCRQIVKACDVVDTSLDATHDLAKTAKYYTNQVAEEARITANSQIAALEKLNIA